MKMSFLDRIQAIKNSPTYHKDYQRYVKQREKDGEIDVTIGPPWAPCRTQSMAGKRLCKKWGLNSPIAPDAPFKVLDYITMTYSKNKLPKYMIDGAVYPVCFPTKDDLKKPTSVTNKTHYDVTHLNGKLCLLIDTSWPPDMIMDVLWKFIEHYSEKNEKRKRDTEDDPWKIYSLYQKKKNLLKIAQKLHHFSELPSYDEEAAKYYKRVERAYRKAIKMINHVEKDAKLKTLLPKK